MCEGCKIMLSALEVATNAFGRYTYGCYRPLNESFSQNLCDSSGFVSWYLSLFQGVPQFMENETYSWNIYDDLKYSKSIILQGKTASLGEYNLLDGDVIIFSVNPSFDVVDPDAYWCGVYFDEDHFMNFNGHENFGSRSLFEYLNDPRFDYSYCCVLRIVGSYGVGHPFPKDDTIEEEPFPPIDDIEEIEV